MGRALRNIQPGSWHHVFNRAVARRPLFESRGDVRHFLAGLARAVRRGEIEVHAWCTLTTHYHLLVRCPQGDLSTAMHRVQNGYAHHFNRSRDRDGPLFRGRFQNKEILSEDHRWRVVGYIDDNPVQAGLSESACDYPWGSARQYATRKGPRWLSRSWVEGFVAALAGRRSYAPSDYSRSAGIRFDDDNGNRSLLDMASPTALARLRQNATRADGHVPRNPLVTAQKITTCISTRTAELGPWLIRAKKKHVDAWTALHVGLLRALAQTTFATIADQFDCSETHAHRLYRRHRQLLRDHPSYAARAAAMTQDALHAAPDTPQDVLRTTAT